MPRDRLGRIEIRLEQLVAGQDELRTSYADLNAAQSALEARASVLDRNMRVLHGYTVGLIKQVAEGHDTLRREMRQGFDELAERIDRRLVPLERTVREHSAVLDRLTHSEPRNGS